MSAAEWTTLAVALLSAGILRYVATAVKMWRDARKEQEERASPEAKHALSLATVDQSLAIVAKARDELEDQNALLTALLAQERAYRASEISDLISRHNAERQTWDMERTSLRAEISDLERRLREMLKEVENIRRRTDSPETNPMKAIRTSPA